MTNSICIKYKYNEHEIVQGAYENRACAYYRSFALTFIFISPNERLPFSRDNCFLEQKK